MSVAGSYRYRAVIVGFDAKWSRYDRAIDIKQKIMLFKDKNYGNNLK